MMMYRADDFKNDYGDNEQGIESIVETMDDHSRLKSIAVGRPSRH